MAFLSTPSGNHTVVATISGHSLLSVSGIELFSGATGGALATILTTTTNLVTFLPPETRPSGITSGSFRVYNLFGSAVEPQLYQYIDPPFISGFTPGSGLTGSTVRITGSGLEKTTRLLFGDVTGDFTHYFDNTHWVISGTVPFINDGLPKWSSVKIFSDGGSATGNLFKITNDSVSFSGIEGLPDDIQAENYLRGNSTASELEWVVPGQVLENISGLKKSNGGDSATGDYTFSGGFRTTGYQLHNTGLQSGSMSFSQSIYSGNYLVMNANIGGVEWRCFSYKFQ